MATEAFNEVNQFNDIDRVIDLNCLDPFYAEVLLRERLEELAAIAHEKYMRLKAKGKPKNQSMVLQVLCGES